MQYSGGSYRWPGVVVGDVRQLLPPFVLHVSCVLLSMRRHEDLLEPGEK